MPKQSMKILVAKTCAFACILGLSANTFVVAGKSIAVERNESVRVAPAAPTAEPSPEPSPLPVRTVAPFRWPGPSMRALGIDGGQFALDQFPSNFSCSSKFL